ncbi:MAG: histidine phosphatase family protein [Pyrinomonadaceae bacterium]
MQQQLGWPQTIWIVRHGESAGNVARDLAEAAGHPVIDLAARDVDVPLSPLGEQQARALGLWFGAMPGEERPTVVLTSPYLRARRTAEIALAAAGLDRNQVSFVRDERLREKEFGIFDRLTKIGAQEKYPEQAEVRTLLGKFYYRPPGGESWCDVMLRLRSVIDTITREYGRERVLLFSHQVVVNCFRYLFEELSEEEILAIDRHTEIANCSVTAYEYDPRAGKRGSLALRLFNFVAPLQAAGQIVTTRPDLPVALK